MYGIYTGADKNFFAGVVASLNSLRYYGYAGPVAVIDMGLDKWQRSYLLDYENVEIIDIGLFKKFLRYTDIKSDDSPVQHFNSFKAFAICEHLKWDKFTWMDADYFAMCNIEQMVLPYLDNGLLVCNEDGINNWNKKHEEAVGVKPGRYININSGLVSFNLEFHRGIIWEWRNLMTRKKPFDLFYLDQGALNCVLDKYDTKKVMLDNKLWNQNHWKERYSNKYSVVKNNDYLIIKETGERIFGWHGTLGNKIWHCVGIDMYRNKEEELAKFYVECQGKIPEPVLEHFTQFLLYMPIAKFLKKDGWKLTLSKNPKLL